MATIKKIIVIWRISAWKDMARICMGAFTV
jgi:hypothetical protein